MRMQNDDASLSKPHYQQLRTVAMFEEIFLGSLRVIRSRLMPAPLPFYRPQNNPKLAVGS